MNWKKSPTGAFLFIYFISFFFFENDSNVWQQTNNLEDRRNLICINAAAAYKVDAAVECNFY